MAADMGFPADCAGDTICTTFKGFLGEARLRVGINAQPSQFSVSAMLVDLKVGWSRIRSTGHAF